MKKIAILCCALLLLGITGCARTADDRAGKMEKIEIPSVLLGKSITSYVYLPCGYDVAGAYPTLYFMASGGGSAYTVINQFEIAQAADAVMQDGEIAPMIIVALGVDFSFGINSADVPGTRTFESERIYNFAEGRYEDYIVQEAIPYIDEHYATRKDRAFRCIGGYSMGGFAALHVGFRNPGLFSKIGGHSPTLFLDTYVTPEIDRWLFPTEEDRQVRDPLRLAETANLAGMRVYLDTGAADVNYDACRALAQKLTERGVDAAFTALPGSHGFSYCREHMPAYLRFYGNLEAE